MNDASSPTKPRWWPAVLILAGAAGGWVYYWFGGDGLDRQSQVMGCEKVVLLATPMLLLWLLCFSRFRWRTRFATLLGLGVLALGFLSLFRFAGVDGDLVPVFESRWRTVETVTTGEKLEAMPGRPDYPQFYGPNRDATVAGPALARDWDAAPPRLVWRRPVGTAWSSFAIAGDVAVTQEQHGAEERVVCYDLATGAIRWSSVVAASYVSTLAGDGPRATPTVDGGRVFSFGGTGVLTANDLITGQPIWTRRATEDAGVGPPEWGASSSPLVVDGRVVVAVGGKDGTLAAYDRETGELAWRGGDDRVGYASPLITTLAGRRQIVSFNGTSVTGHEPADGQVLWSSPWSSRQPNVTQPVPVGENRLLVSSGYGVGSRLLELAAGEGGELVATEIWQSQRMKSKFANLIVHDGAIYGLDDGILACLDLATGRRLWKSGRYGHGQLIRVGDLLLVGTDTGDVVLVELDPTEHRELTRFNAIDGKVWNPPALAGPLLLVRNDREAALFVLPTTK